MSIRTQRNSLPLMCMNFKVPQFPDYYFRDDFDDTIRDPLWTDDPNNGTITEAADVLTLAIANAVHGDFWGVTEDGPVCLIDLSVEYVTVTTKLNSYVVNNLTRAGIFITDVGSGTNGIHFGRTRRDAAPARDGLTVIDMNVAELAYVPLTTLPVWLRVTIEGSGVGSTMVFEYSTDGINWINVYTHNDETWSRIGLLVWNWAPDWSAISAPFEFFMLENPTEQECLAPIDTRAPTVFYDGRIKHMSTLKRAVDDKTGLFQIADMSVTLANEDKHYSQKMAGRILKNQIATLYHAWTEEPEVNKIEVIKLIVEDHSMKGPDFIVKFKDITQKYFTKKVPENICTSVEFPNIHPDHEGRYMPEVLGNATLSTDYEHPGAVEAVYVNTNTWLFLASAGWVNNIIAVYVDDVAAGFSVPVIGADGHKYILLDGDPGDNPTVTFNCEGYSIVAWDSPNGYIQNLAYIIEYFLRFIMGVPSWLVNSVSFATLASHYEDMGVDQNCYLILQDEVDAMEVLRQLLFTGGAKGFMAMDGKFNVERKNICNWEITDIEHHIFEQIELFGSPHRKWNLTSAINTIKAQFAYFPWQNLFTGVLEDFKDNRFDEIMEDDIPIID